MDQQPKIPTLKDSQKPQVKVRGIGIGLTLAERLKQFKKKDLAFILAGLGVLFMAPLAEHFMMAPESADGSLQAGWGKGGSGSGANGVFGGGGSPYDRTDGLAPGSPTGGGSDVITPLNVRDPSALVMGPGAAQQPPTNSALPATPPASAPAARSDSDLKDALAASARGVGAAAKKAPMPVPKVALGGSGLRGLGVAGGGSSASASLGPISAANVPNRAAGGDSTGNARSTKGFSGVARGQTAGSSGIEALKAAAGKQAENMNRGGSAATDLNAAANTAIPSGGGNGHGGGGPGSGREDKGGGGNQDKNSKSTGESLAFLDKKARMEKDRELEYKKKELNDYGLLWSQMRNEGLKTFFTEGLVKPVSSWTGDAIKGLLTPEKAKSVYKCAGGAVVSAGAVGSCKAGATYQATPGLANGNIRLLMCKGDGTEGTLETGGYAGCTKEVSGDEKKDTGKGQAADNANGVASGMSSAQVSSLSELCKLTKEIKNSKVDTNSTTQAIYDDKLKTWAGNVQTGAARIARTQFALVGGTNITACEPEPADSVPSVGISKSVKESQAEALAKLAGSGDAKSADDLISKIKAGAIVEEKKLDAIETKDAEGAVKTAADGVEAVEKYMKASKPTLDEKYAGDTKTLGKDLAAAVVDSEKQLKDARNTLDATYTTLKSVQDGIDTANDKTKVKPQIVDMTKTVVSVSEQNVSLAQFGKELTEGKYEGMGFTIDKVRKIEPPARSASDSETTAAVGTAKEKIAAAKAAVEEFDKKKKKADSDKKTADADLQIDPQMSTQVTRDAVQTSKDSKTAAVSAHETAQTAIKTAVTTVGDMRESQIGWADVMKTAADGLAKTVATPPAPVK